MVIAIIPARGGSKGIPNKNLQLVKGHALLAWSIAAAKATKKINRIIVSTDSDEIAKVAKSYGAEVPFMRPAAFAADNSRDIRFLQHALNWMIEHERITPEFWVQLRPTSPLRTGELIDKAILQMRNNENADSLRVVTKAPITPYKMWTLDENQKLNPLLKMENVAEPYNEPRQSLPVIHWQIGTLDVIRSRTLLEQDSVSGRNILGLEVPQNWALDIDTPEDLAHAATALSQPPFFTLANYLTDV